VEWFFNIKGGKKTREMPKMKELAILGVGRHPWGKFPDKSFSDLAEEACQIALKDANVERKDIQFVSSGVDPYGGTGGMALGLLAGNTVSSRLGLTVPATSCYNGCASGGWALKTAQAYIGAGFCDMALVFGASSPPKGFFAPSGKDNEFDPSDSDFQRFRLFGSTNVSGFAQGALRRMQLYGLTEDDLAEIKVRASKYAQYNPYARFKQVYTKEEVLNSPMVSYPLHLYEICATSDGAAAAVVCSLEKAKKYTAKPVTISAIGIGYTSYNDPGYARGAFGSNAKHAVKGTEFENCVEYRACKAAYEEAGIGPEDLSFAEVYDLSSAMKLDWFEYLQICKEGEAEALFRSGATEIGGRIPIAPSGGIAATGETIPAQALYFVAEVADQLRGRAGKNSVKGAKVGLCVNSGAGGNAQSIIMKR
jgi:acetyl-CoA acetyltransferase